MSSKEYNTRRDKVLELIIDSYVDTAVPVASRTISRKLRLSLSPATIRNVMSDLEEMGLITHPHTSAGRIPTEKGYRYYIDKLMQAKLLTEDEKRHINKEFRTRVNELDEMLDKASGILSSITKQTGIVLFPFLQQSVFKHVQFVKLDQKRLFAVLLTDSGFAKDLLIDMDDDIDSSELLRISNFINSHIDKGSLAKIRRDIVQSLLAERDSFFYVLEKARSIIDLMLDMVKEEKLYLYGRSRLAEQPEFNDVGKLRDIFRMIEDEDLLLSVLHKTLDEENAKVYIGSELGNELSGCSLITERYSVGESRCGALGIIGPTRMEYAKMVPIVGYVASTLSDALSHR